MKLNDAYPGKYLKAGDVSETGDVFTIKGCEMEELGQGADKQIKPVLYFEDEEKGFVLNKTNFKTIVELTGQGDSDDWAGVEVTLFTTEVQFGADMVESIRVKKKVNRSPATSTKAAAATASVKESKPELDALVASSKNLGNKKATPEVEATEATEPKGETGTPDDDDPPF